MQRSSGWYRDPDDPTRLRHWNGRDWTGPRRSLPAWLLSDTDVVLEPSWGNLQTAPGGPLLEGPVRPTPLPAATRGSLAEHRGDHVGGRTQRLVRPAVRATAGGATAGGTGHGAAFEAAPWAPVRRPLMVFCALVGVAVLMMAGTVIGVNRSTGAANSAVGSDTAFLARATSICQAGLGALRSAGQTAMSVPGDTSVLATGAQRNSVEVGAVEQQLRSVPVTPSAAPAVGDWLDTIGRYVTDEAQLAASLAPAPATPASAPATESPASASPASASPASASPAAGLGPTASEEAATRARADVNQADVFAGANALTACSLAPSANGSALTPIP